MPKGKIYCLMGKSGSGKDTVFRALMQKADLHPVVPYTTRPMRAHEQDGREYHFIDQERLADFMQQGKIIEVRHYDTVYGVWSYATIDDGQIDLNSGNYLMITTLEAFQKIVSYYGGDAVIPLYLYLEDGTRLERAIEREKEQKSPGYTELCRRFLADCEDFSQEKLEQAGIQQGYHNLDLETCVSEIIDKEGFAMKDRLSRASGRTSPG